MRAKRTYRIELYRAGKPVEGGVVLTDSYRNARQIFLSGWNSGTYGVKVWIDGRRLKTGEVLRLFRLRY